MPSLRLMRAPVEVLQKLNRSQIYQEYERAYEEATRLPLALRPPEVWIPALRGKRHENPFCALLAKTNRTCAGCLETQRRLSDPKAQGPTSVTCFAGMCETAIPVRLGEQLIGYLQTGQVALQEPNAASFQKIAAQLIQWGTKVDLGRLEDAYLHSRVLSPGQYGAMVHLLEIFARHLALVANQLVVEHNEAEPPMVRRARAFIAGHQTEPLTLEQVAAALHVSTYYFCRTFKKVTGLTFTQYLGRVRVEKTKALLANPNLSVSEIAYDTGFGSLTHFNRVFRMVVGQSPTTYRHWLAELGK